MTAVCVNVFGVGATNGQDCSPRPVGHVGRRPVEACVGLGRPEHFGRLSVWTQLDFTLDAQSHEPFQAGQQFNNLQRSYSMFKKTLAAFSHKIKSYVSVVGFADVDPVDLD